jgi:hypothetical protein
MLCNYSLKKANFTLLLIHYLIKTKTKTMRTIKNLSLLFVAAIFAMGVNAQSSSTTPSSKPAQTTAPAGAKGSTGSKTTAAPTNVKAADPLDPAMKGPKGEKVYTGAKGGKYYLNAKGNKTYLKPETK